MRLLQNLVIADNGRCFESLVLNWKTFLIVSEWAGKATDVTSENVLHQQSSLFWFLGLQSADI